MPTRLLMLLLLLACACGCVTDKGAPNEEGCHTYLVVPPPHKDEIASDELISLWTTAAHPLLGRCDKITKPAAAKTAFRLVQVDHLTDNHPDALSEAQLLHLKDLTEATDAVFLNYRIEGSQVKLRPAVYRLYPLKKLQSSPLQKPQVVALAKDSHLREGAMVQWSARLINLLPNSFQFGASPAQYRNTRADSGDVMEIDSTPHSALPPLLSSFAWTSVKHPNTLANWDIDFGVQANLATYYLDTSYRFITDADKSTVHHYDLTMFTLLPSASGIVYVHTPLGTTSLGVGPGVALFTYSDTFTERSNGIRPAVVFSLAHHIFMTDRWFLDVSAHSTTFLLVPPLVDNSLYRLDQISSAELRLGYFFPEIRSLVHEVR